MDLRVTLFAMDLIQHTVLLFRSELGNQEFRFSLCSRAKR